jgi:hypothetical protein
MMNAVEDILAIYELFCNINFKPKPIHITTHYFSVWNAVVEAKKQAFISENEALHYHDVITALCYARGF